MSQTTLDLLGRPRALFKLLITFGTFFAPTFEFMKITHKTVKHINLYLFNNKVYETNSTQFLVSKGYFFYDYGFPFL